MRFDAVAFDLDGVMVAERSSWEWVHRHFGVDNSESLAAFCGGKIDDDEFMRSDIALWMEKEPGLTREQVREILLRAKLVKGSEETVRHLKSMGVKTCIISGGIDLLAQHVGHICGVDRVMSNGLATDQGGRLLGEGILRVELRDKAKALFAVLEEFGVEPQRCAAVGNSWVDVTMFKISGYGIAFNPIDASVMREADVVVESDDIRDILPHLE